MVARLLGISTAAVNQHAAKVGVRKMDIKTKSAVIRWDSDEVDVTVIFQNPLEEVCEDIPPYKGKAKIGQLEGTNYVMIISDYVLTSLCGRVMGYICDHKLTTAITAIVTISDEEPVDGFVEGVNLPFGGYSSGSFPLVLICLKKMLLPM